jgi:hypothetical protein
MYTSIYVNTKGRGREWEWEGPRVGGGPGNDTDADRAGTPRRTGRQRQPPAWADRTNRARVDGMAEKVAG